MSMEVKVPSLGESITSGILSTWHVNSGDYVESGQPIYDLETDKITSEGMAEAAGVIELKVDEGEEVDIGVAVVGDELAGASGESSLSLILTRKSPRMLPPQRSLPLSRKKKRLKKARNNQQRGHIHLRFGEWPLNQV